LSTEGGADRGQMRMTVSRASRTPRRFDQLRRSVLPAGKGVPDLDPDHSSPPDVMVEYFFISFL